MSSSQSGLYYSFALYLLLVTGIGWIAWRKTLSLADYILGGRGLGRWVAALSAGASDMSGWLLLGLPGYAYLAGLEAVWIAAGLLVGTWLNWRLVAPRLRDRSEALDNALTLPAYFDRRFAGEGHGLRILTGFFILLFFLFWVVLWTFAFELSARQSFDGFLVQIVDSILFTDNTRLCEMRQMLEHIPHRDV